MQSKKQGCVLIYPLRKFLTQFGFLLSLYKCKKKIVKFFLSMAFKESARIFNDTNKLMDCKDKFSREFSMISHEHLGNM